MAIIHISEAEAARDLPALLAKVRSGERVQIDSGSEVFTIVRAKQNDALRSISDIFTGPIEEAPAPSPRKLSEAIRLSESRSSNITLDDQFGNDLEEIIRSHENERLRDPWESS